MTIDDFVALLEARGCRPRRSGKGWVARCPAHEDRRPSLAAGSGDDGRILVKCFTGCPTEAICGALGITLADLMPPKDDPRPSRARHGGNGKAKREKKPEVFPTARAAVHALERTLGQRSALWTYRDAQGQPAGVVVRWDTPQGKEIRPIARCNGGWRIGQMPEPRPLYHLPEVIKADPGAAAWVVEGERCTDTLADLGLLATSSAGGSQAAAKTDWQPLKGRKVVIVPDCDAPGRRYAEEVARLVHAGGAKEIRILDLGLRFPDLPEGFDAADLAADPTAVGLAQGATAEALRAMLERWADETPVWTPAEAHDPDGSDDASLDEHYEPFPADALPEPLRRFVIEGADALQCDHAHIALPLLSMAAAAIGNSRRLRLKRDWTVPPTLWTVIVAESGQMKTPALRLVLRPVRERQRKALEAYAEAVRSFESDLLVYEKTLAEWKRSKDPAAIPPAKPEPPQCERFIVNDTTLEALAPLLLANPRGLLLTCDELTAWVGSFDRYANTKGGDLGRWLSVHAGEALLVDRKTEPRTIFVPHPALSICGGVQPSILKRLMGDSYRESGLAARILWAFPPKRRKRWTEAEIAPETQADIIQLLDRLFALESAIDEDGRSCPVVLGLTPDAKALWTNFYDAHAAELIDLEGDLASAWAKLEEAAARLALVMHCVRRAFGHATTDAVDVISMQAGIELATWFKREARRIHNLFSETDADADRRRLIEWIEGRGGAAAARDLTRGPRKFRSKPGEAEEALAALVKAGIGCWELSPENQKGGRSTRVFRLNPEWRRRHNLKKRPKNEGFVAVASVAGEPSPPVTPEPPNPMPPVGGGDTEAAATPAREGGDDDWEVITL